MEHHYYKQTNSNEAIYQAVPPTTTVAIHSYHSYRIYFSYSLLRHLLHLPAATDEVDTAWHTASDGLIQMNSLLIAGWQDPKKRLIKEV